MPYKHYFHSSDNLLDLGFLIHRLDYRTNVLLQFPDANTQRCIPFPSDYKTFVFNANSPLTLAAVTDWSRMPEFRLRSFERYEAAWPGLELHLPAEILLYTVLIGITF